MYVDNAECTRIQACPDKLVVLRRICSIERSVRSPTGYRSRRAVEVPTVDQELPRNRWLELGQR